MSSTFGKVFRVTTFGESHGGGVGAVIDGCPAGYAIDLQEIQAFLNRRRPGQSHLASPRAEKDQVVAFSGLEGGVTLGSPICLMVRNEDANPEHYRDVQKVFRPSHADFTTYAKYGVRAASGGGRASARETIGRVAAASVAEQFISQMLPNFRVVAFVDRVRSVSVQGVVLENLTRQKVEASPLRSPPGPWLAEMEQEIVAAREQGDSVGGSITCFAVGLPAGLGEPVFDKLQADLAKAVMSLPATRSFEIGLGRDATFLLGSEHNDSFEQRDGKIRTQTNRSGGIQGGISNGETVYFRVGFKPVATIFKDQKTVDENGDEVVFRPKLGRHDPCVLPRAVPMVEAMAILTFTDHLLRQRVQTGIS